MLTVCLLLALLFALPALVGAWVWRGVALRMGWIDQPDARRLHVQPTPRGGGVGILLALAMAIPPLLGLQAPYGAILLGLLLTAAGGLLDDLRPLSAVPKLLLQAAGTLPLAWVLPLDVPGLGPVAGVLLAWGFVLAMVNAWNFMDGSNGLVASQGALVGAAAVMLAAGIPGAAATGLGAQPLLVLGIALAGACVGFLPMNVPRAKIFLGDVGSHAIGYAVAALALLALRQPGWPEPLVWLPGSAVVIDTALTLAARIARGERFWMGHREHLYQRAIAAGWSHVGIAAAYAGWTVAASALAIGLADSTMETATAVAVAVYTAGILLYLRLGRLWARPVSMTETLG